MQQKNETQFERTVIKRSYRPIIGYWKRERTNVELVKCGKTNDDDGIGALCYDVTKEDRKSDENGDEEKVGRRGGQGTDEENPCIGLETSQAGEENMIVAYSPW